MKKYLLIIYLLSIGTFLQNSEPSTVQEIIASIEPQEKARALALPLPSIHSFNSQLIRDLPHVHQVYNHTYDECLQVFPQINTNLLALVCMQNLIQRLGIPYELLQYPLILGRNMSSEAIRITTYYDGSHFLTEPTLRSEILVPPDTLFSQNIPFDTHWVVMHISINGQEGKLQTESRFPEDGFPTLFIQQNASHVYATNIPRPILR